ncbi:MAG: hypothetical protein II047_09780, partial [Bacteroidales bacterium]|nr:hypothetical protein [Bacteroidales bacterium]
LATIRCACPLTPDAPARPLRVSVKALTALSHGGVGKVEFYTGDLPRRIWLESDFWGRSQDYFSTFPTVATGGRKEGHCTEPTGTPGR